MAALDVGFMPVADTGGLVGVVTDRDITVRSVAKGEDPGKINITEVMTPNVVTLPENTDVQEAAKLMEEKQIRRIVVKGEGNSFVGVVSLGDLAVKTKDQELSGEALEEISKPAEPQR